MSEFAQGGEGIAQFNYLMERSGISTSLLSNWSGQQVKLHQNSLGQNNLEVQPHWFGANSNGIGEFAQGGEGIVQFNYLMERLDKSISLLSDWSGQ